MMLKKIAFAAPLAVLALGSSMAFAVEPITHAINMRAFIPTNVFNVGPQDPEFGKDVELVYNEVSGELNTKTAIFNLRNTDPKGAINAFIEGGQAAASLYNGSTSIPLTVSMGSVELNEKSTEVVNETDSVPGVQRQMSIKAAKPTAAQTGNFTGNFTVVYEPVAK